MTRHELGYRLAAIVLICSGACGPSVDLTDADGGSTTLSPNSSGSSGTGTASGPQTSGGPVPPSSTGGDSTTSSSTAMVESDGEDEAVTAEGCGFPVRCDGGFVAFECDLFAQDCPRDQKCMPYAFDRGVAWNATRCSPLFSDSSEIGEPCSAKGTATTGIDHCVAGGICWNVDELGQGVCEDFCQGSAEAPMCPSASDRCVIINGGALSLCLAACDPLIQDCVVANEACIPVGGHWVCVPDGADAPGGHGDPCDFANACDLGMVCVGAPDIEGFPGAPPPPDCDAALGCCTALCDLTDGGADAFCQSMDPLHACEPWPPGATPAGTDPALGRCALPR